MSDYVLPVVLIAAVGGVLWYWRHTWVREQIRQRLKAGSESDDTAEIAELPFARRHHIFPWVCGIVVAALLIFAVNWPNNISVALGVVVALLLTQVDAWILEIRLSRIESQLADCIDMLVASVQAGSSLQSALEVASNEIMEPLKGELQEMVARLRLGDAPTDVFELLRQRVPAETFRLFCTTLSVNWEVGGGLANTLASIGQTIRDRITISRQIRTLSTQGRITTLAVLSITYLLAAMMWQSDPPRMIGFLSIPTGQWLVTGALLLQGIGIAMVAKLSRPKV
jgi:tight adherence protein B